MCSNANTSECNRIKNSDIALGWCIAFEVLGFKPGLKYWRKMNLHVTREQAKIIHLEAALAANACDQPLPEAEEGQDRNEQYLQSCQQPLDNFLERIKAKCGPDVRKEILDWAEFDFVVELWSGKEATLWFFSLLGLKNYKKHAKTIDVDVEKLKKIADVIENELWIPWSTLIEKFKCICASLDGTQDELEECSGNFTTIAHVIARVDVRRCWESMQKILSPEEQDAIFQWYLERNKGLISALPKVEIKIAPPRIPTIRDT